MRGKLFSVNGELSLDGRALLYWLRLKPVERYRSVIGPPLHSMRMLLDRLAVEPSKPLHPSLESRRQVLISECRKVVESL